MAGIVLATVYFTNRNDVLAINEVEKERTRTPNHRVTVQVAGLIGGAKIEIAALPVKH